MRFIPSFKIVRRAIPAYSELTQIAPELSSRGGMPGTVHLGEDDTVSQVIREFAKEGKLVAAICAAPSVLGQAGILNGKKAACHPGFEEKLTGAEVFFSPVVCDGNVITSRGMGTAVPFGLAVARYFTDDATIEHVKAGLVYA